MTNSPPTNIFETVVKNNLHFWLRNFSWQQNPDVATLIIEKENLMKAIQAGLRYRSTCHMAIHLLFVTTDIMLQIGGPLPWIQLTQSALKRCPKEDEYVRGRLLLCQAKQLILAKRYAEGEKLLTEAAESARKNCDVDLQWEISYYHGISCVRNGRIEIASQCVDAVTELMKYSTLLHPALCQGHIAMLRGEIELTKGNLNKAEKSLTRAVDHLKKERATHPLTLALDMLGVCYAQTGKHSKALDAWQNALVLIPEGFDFRTRSHLLVKLTDLNIKSQNLAAAEKQLNSLAFNKMRSTGCLDIHLKAVLLLGRISESKGDNERATLIFENAKILQNELDRPELI